MKVNVPIRIRLGMVNFPWLMLYIWASALSVLHIMCVTKSKYLSPNGQLLLSHSIPKPIQPIKKLPVDTAKLTNICRTCKHLHKLGSRLPWKDPRILEEIRDRIELPPLGILDHIDPVHPPWGHLESFNSSEFLIRSIFQRVTNGTFVEIGCQDGLWMSNTWWLESAQDWQGLLVEADSVNYQDLRASPRKSRTLNACVIPGKYTKKQRLLRYPEAKSQSTDIQKLQRGKTKLQEYATKSEKSFLDTWEDTCIPLISILRAAGYKNIELLTVDISGGGYEMVYDFLRRNNKLDNPFQVQVVLYQDITLIQFIDVEDLEKSFHDLGYALKIIREFHYLLVHHSTKIVFA